jgi:cell division protein FtsB
MQRRDLTRLVRILGLLGSDQPGERAAAAMQAHKLVTSLGLSWTELLDPPPKEVKKVVVQRVRDYDIDQQAAADARMRQLKDTNDRLEKEVRALRRRVAGVAEQQRKAREMAEE